MGMRSIISPLEYYFGRRIGRRKVAPGLSPKSPIQYVLSDFMLLRGGVSCA